MAFAPVPPYEMLPARTVRIADRGEFFLRDSGGDGPVVLLLHGWIASGDLNWSGAYRELDDAGYRVLAIDHRGHGRGLRQLTDFRLADCAADAAAVLRELDVAPATVVGYSMGGAIGQLIARDHADVISGLLLSGTAQSFDGLASQRYRILLGLFGLALALAPRGTWRRGLKRIGMPESEQTAWLLAELNRHSARDIAEAGRELARFDSRPWLRPLQVPAAVLVTTKDRDVPVHKQHELAEALEAAVFEAPVTHLGVVTQAYNGPLLEAIAAVAAQRDAQAA